MALYKVRVEAVTTKERITKYVEARDEDTAKRVASDGNFRAVWAKEVDADDTEDGEEVIEFRAPTPAENPDQPTPADDPALANPADNPDFRPVGEGRADG